MSEDEQNNTEELLGMINSIIDEPLAAEIMLFAMKALKEDPELTIYEAIYSGQLEWDV